MTVKNALLATLLMTALSTTSFSLQAQELIYSDSDKCSGCEMMITQWPGPKAQVLKQGGEPQKYCSVRCILCNTLERVDIDSLEIRAHNAAKVDWEHPGNGPHVDVKKA